MASPYFYEFLYRGRPPGGKEEPNWHIMLGADGIDAFKRPFHDEVVLNSSQAAAAGWALPAVIAAINTDILQENERFRTKISELEAQIANLTLVPKNP